MSQATTTTDHDEIRRWAEERGGRPSVVRTARGRGGILRFDFGEEDEKLEETTWDEFFQIFDERELAFLHQETIGDGATSRFFKFVARDAAPGQRGHRRASAGKSASSRRGAAATSTRTGAAKRTSTGRGAARGAAKAGTRGASKAGAKTTAKKSRSAASSAGLRGATKRGRTTTGRTSKSSRTSRKRTR